MRYLMWLLKAAIFFTLFAFALNNQQIVAVNFFFGTVWKAPLVMVVMVVFATGLVLGVLLMIPRWWKNNRHRNAGNAGHQGTSDWADLPISVTVPEPVLATNSAPVAPALYESAPTKVRVTAHGL